MMKPTILFILHLPPPVHGAAMMGKYIHDSRLINDAFECHYINLTTAKNLEDIGKVRPSKLNDFGKLLSTIRHTVKQVRPELVYVTPNACGGAFYKDFVVVQMLKSMGCRVVVHYHNKGVKTRENRFVDNILYKKFFKGIKVILLGESLFDDVRKYVLRKNVFLCANGIPYVSHVIKKRDNFVPHILMLSNLLVDKGVLVLLDSLRMLKDKGLAFVCDFVGGETSEIDKTRFGAEAIARGLKEVAVYHGRKYGDDKEQMYAQADIFVLPSFNEAFPLVNLEAMSHHLPIVSTLVGGIPVEITNGENGLLCPARDARSLAQSLELLLGNAELRKDMGENGFMKFKREFTLEVFEENLKGVLAECVKL